MTNILSKTPEVVVGDREAGLRGDMSALVSRIAGVLPWLILLATMAVIFRANDAYLFTVSITIILWAVLASGLNVILGYCGYYHLGLGAFYGIGAYGAALLSVKAGQPMIVPVVVMPIIAAVLGFIIGPIVLRIRGLHFAVATLSIGMIASDVANNWVALTGGPIGIVGIRRPPGISLGWLTLNTRSVSGMFVLACLMLVFITGLVAYFRRTTFALVLRGIKSDELQLRSFGFKTTIYKVVAFSIAGSVAALAGVYYAYFIQFVSPEPFSFFSASFQIFVVLAVGGPGTLWGPLLGSILLTGLPEILELDPQLKLIVYGVVLFLVIAFFPGGLSSIFETVRGRLIRRKPTPR